MADQAATTPPESLREFLTWTDGALTEDSVWRVWHLARQYEGLAPFLDKGDRPKRIEAAYLNEDNKSVAAVLREALTDAASSIETVPVQVRKDLEEQVPVGRMDERKLSEHVDRLENARKGAKEATESARATQRATNRKWIGNVVDRWVRSIPVEQRAEVSGKLTTAIEHNIDDRPNLPPDAIVNEALREVEKVAPSAVRRMTHDDRVIHQVAEIQQAQREKIDTTIAKAVMESPRPDVAVAAIKAGLERSAPTHPVFYVATTKRTVERAAKVADAAVAFTADPETIRGAAGDMTGFFKVVAASSGSPTQRALAPIADVVMSMFPREVRDNIAASVIGKAGGEQLSRGSVIDRFLGGIFATESVRAAVRNGNATMASARGAGGLLTGPGKIAGDVFGSIFKPNVTEEYLTLVALSHRSAIEGFHASDWRQFYLAMTGSVGERVAAWGAKKAASKGAKEVGKFVAKKAATTALGKAIGGTLGSALGPVGTAIGAFIGDVVIDKALGFIVGIAKGALSLLSGGWLSSLMMGGNPLEEGPWYTRATTLFMLLVLVVIVLPMTFLGSIFTGFGGMQLHNAVSSSAFAIPIGNEYLEPIGPPVCDPATDPQCAVAGCQPGRDCRWPTSGGCITQGSYVPDPNGTHHTMNAIDVGAVHHTDVTATHDGVVVATETKYGDNEFVRGVYGNYVKLEGTDSKGNKFYTIYAHLWIVVVQPGQTVKAGDPLGKTDNNGHSFGEHLHYEYRGGGDISTILPQPVPHCSYGTCPSICW